MVPESITVTKEIHLLIQVSLERQTCGRRVRKLTLCISTILVEVFVPCGSLPVGWRGYGIGVESVRASWFMGDPLDPNLSTHIMYAMC